MHDYTVYQNYLHLDFRISPMMTFFTAREKEGLADDIFLNNVCIIV